MQQNRAVYALYVLVLAGSFFITLWLTGPKTTTLTKDGNHLERLVAVMLTNKSDLFSAAIEAGLRRSTTLRGHVDVVRRHSSKDVLMEGWVAERGGNGQPLDVVIFVQGRSVGLTRTQGPRADVTKAIGLERGAEKNVVFQVTFACQAGTQPLVIGLNEDGDYVPLSSALCPP